MKDINQEVERYLAYNYPKDEVVYNLKKNGFSEGEIEAAVKDKFTVETVSANPFCKLLTVAHYLFFIFLMVDFYRLGVSYYYPEYKGITLIVAAIFVLLIVGIWMKKAVSFLISSLLFLIYGIIIYFNLISGFNIPEEKDVIFYACLFFYVIYFFVFKILIFDNYKLYQKYKS